MPPYTPERETPDGEALVVAILKAGGIPHVWTDAPHNLELLLPAVVCYRVSGESPAPNLLDRVTMHFEYYGASRELTADLAETCRVLLHRAARNRTGIDGAALNRIEEILAPFERKRESPQDRVWRFDSMYSLRIRPAS